MANSSTSVIGDIQGGKRLCLIVGLVAIAGYLLGILSIFDPSSVTSTQWRFDFLQQLGDRSVLLVFGLALMVWGLSRAGRLVKQLSLVCLILGIVLSLLPTLVIHDTLALRDQAFTNITQQADSLQSQIEAAGDSSDSFEEQVSPEAIRQALQSVALQAESLKETAKSSITKTGIVSLGNLLIVGLGLIALGRWGAMQR